MTEAEAPKNAATEPIAYAVTSRVTRKAYATPTVSPLGNVRELTRAGTASTSRDALGANRRKLIPRVG